MNRLDTQTRGRLFSALCEGMSLRGVARHERIAFNTVLKFNVEVGRFCERFQAHLFQDLSINTIECDEIWAFVGTKEERKREDQPEGWGSVYTWTAIDPETRLMPVWHVGGREFSDAYAFIQKLKYAIKDDGEKLQLVSDGNKTYLPAVEDVFGDDIDYMHYYKTFFASDIPEYRRYCMPRLESASRKVMKGTPDASLTTNHVERNNLTIRCGPRRFVRMTNAFSKKLENHRMAVAMHMMTYNFVRVHGPLGCTPAMAAGLTDHVWDRDEIMEMMLRPLVGVNTD